MGKLADFTENNWKYNRGSLSLHGCRNGDWTYRQGSYRHPLGIVEVFMDEGTMMLTKVVAGRMYARHWKGNFKDYTISRLCREFLEARP